MMWQQPTDRLTRTSVSDVTVVVVEVRALARNLLKDMVHAALGDMRVRVVEAADGAEGLAHLGTAHADVVVADAETLAEDGSEFCRQVRDAARTVPVVLVAPADGFHRTAQTDGATAVLRKPVYTDDLGIILRRLVRRAA